MAVPGNVQSDSNIASTMEVEKHGIDFIPTSERQGHPRDLLTLWFGANAMAITLVTGGVAVRFGVGMLWASIAIAIGALTGIVFVAYHSAQGPQLGLPQMIQSRAQFGFYGANFPMLIVVLMYLGFFAGGAVVGAELISSLLSWSSSLGVAALSALAIALVIFGYKMLHLVGKVLTPAYVVVFALLTFAVIKNWHGFPGASVAFDREFKLAPFMAIVSIIAAYYISYGPYVADYSRYLPEDTSAKAAFWYTYAGVALSAIWVMILGAATQIAFPAVDTVLGIALVADSLGPWMRVATLLTLIVGVAYINAFNLYGSMMSCLTITTTFIHGVSAARWLRLFFTLAAGLVGGLLASIATEDFVAAFERFVFFIVTFLIPWSAINLVDYYFIRLGKYVPEDLFTPSSKYGRLNYIGLLAYLIGAVAQVPFIDQAFYRGNVAAILGFDGAWIVGLVVPGFAYYLLARKRIGRSPN